MIRSGFPLAASIFGIIATWGISPLSGCKFTRIFHAKFDEWSSNLSLTLIGRCVTGVIQAELKRKLNKRIFQLHELCLHACVRTGPLLWCNNTQRILFIIVFMKHERYDCYICDIRGHEINGLLYLERLHVSIPLSFLLNWRFRIEHFAFFLPGNPEIDFRCNAIANDVESTVHAVSINLRELFINHDKQVMCTFLYNRFPSLYYYYFTLLYYFYNISINFF